MGWARKWSHQQLEAHAHCDTCGWVADSRNAHGIGVQHARKNSHQVVIVVTQQYSYGPVPYGRGDEE